MTVRVRSVTEADIEELNALATKFHQESRYKDYPNNTDKQTKHLLKAISDPGQYGILIAEYNGKIVGFLYAYAAPYIAGDFLLGTVNVFYVDSAYRDNLLSGKIALKLIKAVMQWSKYRNCAELQFYVTSGIDPARTDRFYRRLGFKTTGANYYYCFE